MHHGVRLIFFIGLETDLDGAYFLPITAFDTYVDPTVLVPSCAVVVATLFAQWINRLSKRTVKFDLSPLLRTFKTRRQVVINHI